MVSFVLLSACSTPTHSPNTAISDLLPPLNPTVEFPTSDIEPQDSPSDSKHLETIVILGTNDIHGTLTPSTLKSREAPGVTPVAYESGGATMISAYIKKLKSEYQDRLIWLDGGDQFQGSIESNTETGKPMVDFFNASGLTASAVGNHEFDFSLPVLK